MNRRGILWAIIVVAVAFVLSLRYSGGFLPSGNDRTVHVVELVPQPDCVPLGRTCRALGEALALGIQLPADARPMRGFPVQVTVEGEVQGVADAVFVEFSMTGMDMGVNRFQLEHQGPGVWTGKVTLPVCSTGRNDWLAVVDMDRTDRRYRAEFPVHFP